VLHAHCVCSISIDITHYTSFLWWYQDYMFFFSSRRRHTRSKRDWSSDVCSSDLMITNWATTPMAMGQGRRATSLRSGIVSVNPKIGRASCRERVESTVADGGGKEKGRK